MIWQRDDPAGEAFFSVQDLKVTTSAIVPQLAVASGSNGAMDLDLRGTPGQTYELQATDDLTKPIWTFLASGTPDTSGHWRTSDPGASSRPKRFYRAAAKP